MLVYVGASSLQFQWYGSGASYAYATVNQIGTVNQISTVKAVAGALSKAAPVLHRSSPGDLCAAFSWILPLGGECLCADILVPEVRCFSTTSNSTANRLGDDVACVCKP
jgi:hypothetical protein